MSLFKKFNIAVLTGSILSATPAMAETKHVPSETQIKSCMGKAMGGRFIFKNASTSALNMEKKISLDGGYYKLRDHFDYHDFKAVINMTVRQKSPHRSYVSIKLSPDASQEKIPPYAFFYKANLSKIMRKEYTKCISEPPIPMPVASNK